MNQEEYLNCFHHFEPICLITGFVSGRGKCIDVDWMCSVCGKQKRERKYFLSHEEWLLSHTVEYLASLGCEEIPF